MAKTGVLSSDPTVRAKAVELKKELQRLVRTIVDDDDYSIHAIDRAKDALCALRGLIMFNKRSSPATFKLREAVPCPEEFKCPLSNQLMRDPVILASGQTYDRPFIQKWLNAGNRTCPRTQQVLSHTILTPNHLIREMISQWCKSQGIELPNPVQCGREEGITEAECDRFFSLLDKLSAAVPEQKEAAKELRLLTKKVPSFRALFGESVDAITQLLTPLNFLFVSSNNLSNSLYTIHLAIFSSFLNFTCHMLALSLGGMNVLENPEMLVPKILKIMVKVQREVVNGSTMCLANCIGRYLLLALQTETRMLCLPAALIPFILYTGSDW
ncbi:hypothetical protein GOBAR_DD20617 [Gossypium barbadense]|nr:hypothetical protein GOBAR_DD20617 [Gossypium barbadense]